jgi:hypothetical protein
MGKIKPYPPVKLIAAVAISDIDLWAEFKEKLEALYSDIDIAMDWYDFHHTDYYLTEMGENLKKRMISFRELVLAEQLPDIKLATNQLEKEFAKGGKRRLNIDPGYICTPKLVLATTKDFSHRIYLKEGIFGDIHLKYQKGSFRPQEWTYPDYREPDVIRFFNQVREVYLEQMAGEVF